MGKLTKKEKERLTASQKDIKQKKIREDRAQQVSSGAYRPRSTVFDDKRQKNISEAQEDEIREFDTQSSD